MQITVEGSAEREFAPERAFVHVSVGTELPDRTLAVQRATEVANRLRGEIDGLGDAVASVVQLGPTTESWRSNDTMPTTHSATVTLIAEFVDFAVLPRFLATAAVIPTARVRSVYWALTDATLADKRDEVVAEAVAAASRRASAIAAAAGAGTPVLTAVADVGLLTDGGAAGGNAEADLMMGAPPSEFSARAAMVGEVNLAPAPILVQERVHARFMTGD